jgi:hypothetical protein
MSIASPRVLLISIGVGLALSVLLGGIYSLLGERSFLYAIGTVSFVLGLVALAVGLLGGAEPQEGWATGRGANRRQEGRRSMVAKATREADAIEEVTSGALIAWGVIVGGGLIVLSMVAFGLGS